VVHTVAMGVGFIEIKPVQRTMNNGAVAEAEQVQIRRRHVLHLLSAIQ